MTCRNECIKMKMLEEECQNNSYQNTNRNNNLLVLIFYFSANSNKQKSYRMIIKYEYKERKTNELKTMCNLIEHN